MTRTGRRGIPILDGVETAAAATVCTTATTAFKAVLHTTGTSGL